MRFFAVLMKQSANQAKGPINTLLGRAFGKYLLLTNTVTCGGLMGIGDFCQQQIEKYQKKPRQHQYDVQRTVNMTTVAFGHGVFHHFFYGWMDRVLPGAAIRTVCSKILLDQLIASPACLWIFFIGMAILEKRGYSGGWNELKEKFLFCYTVDWIVWPPNQFINFYFMPPKYRVIYINFLTTIYDVFMSYIKFFDQGDSEKPQEEKK